MQDEALAKKYLPIIMVDEKEPFKIQAIGYTVFRNSIRSDSFPKRIIAADWNQVNCVIEYAIWFDYDIQHLYELEHVWIYVGKDGNVRKVEGSFHGKYLNMVNLDTGEPVLNEAGQAIVWMQPGKHALLPDPRLVKVVPEWEESCTVLAGADGLAVPDAFRGWLPPIDEAGQQRICDYIKTQYAFEPSLCFEEMKIDRGIVMPWRELRESIPNRLARELDKMGVRITHGQE